MSGVSDKSARGQVSDVELRFTGIGHDIAVAPVVRDLEWLAADVEVRAFRDPVKVPAMALMPSFLMMTNFARACGWDPGAGQRMIGNLDALR